MNQRAGKTHKAALVDSDKIRYTDLVEFCKRARTDLESEGDGDAALRFEILEDCYAMSSVVVSSIIQK